MDCMFRGGLHGLGPRVEDFRHLLSGLGLGWVSQAMCILQLLGADDASARWGT